MPLHLRLHEEKTWTVEILRWGQSLSESRAPRASLKYAIEDVSLTKALAYKKKAPSAFLLERLIRNYAKFIVRGN